MVHNKYDFTEEGLPAKDEDLKCEEFDYVELTPKEKFLIMFGLFTALIIFAVILFLIVTS